MRFKNILISFVLALPFLTGCSQEEGSFFAAALGLGETRIITASTQAGSYALTMYDANGQLLNVVFDYNTLGDVPFGLALFDASHVIVSLNGTDRLDKVSIITGERGIFATSSLFTGNIYDTVKDRSGNYLTVESNTIEKFDSNGNRVPIAGATPYINTTTGSCVLSTPHGLTITLEGYLVAVSSGGTDNLSVYDISGSTASCVTNVAFGNDPWAVTQHTNGYLYVVTQLNDSVYRVDRDGTNAQIIWASNTSVINNPQAIAEHPNGNLLVSSSGTDAIIEIDTSGNVVASPFIKNAYTNDVYDILIVGGQ